ncbi:DUF805 domain-containing protein [Lacticaseibacillus hegangensis]|uniref:DUF805 domain-containing protein n=1 Tax=Lacticaseibacillus hegangensis TaxID=2486010 RepID=A0ABW4D017_9LACO|nr:DUF805 domain-containing protein [Lacticaseibacillus hegangensis]
MAIKSTHVEQISAHNRYYRATGVTVLIAFWGNCLNFKGRSSRSEYWGPALLVAALVSVVATTLTVSLIGSSSELTNGLKLDQLFGGLGGGLLIILFVVIGLPSITLFIRRSRDAGIPWWFYVIILTLNLVSYFIPNAPSAERFLTGAVSLTILILTLFLILALKPSRSQPTSSSKSATAGNNISRDDPDRPYTEG